MCKRLEKSVSLTMRTLSSSALTVRIWILPGGSTSLFYEFKSGTSRGWGNAVLVYSLSNPHNLKTRIAPSSCSSVSSPAMARL
jgi:hypothetical protein